MLRSTYNKRYNLIMEKMYHPETDYDFAGWVVTLRFMGHIASSGLLDHATNPASIVKASTLQLCRAAADHSHRLLPLIDTIASNPHNTTLLALSFLERDRATDRYMNIQPSLVRAVRYLAANHHASSYTHNREVIKDLEEPIALVYEYCRTNNFQQDMTLAAIDSREPDALARRIAKTHIDAAFYIGLYDQHPTQGS